MGCEDITVIVKTLNRRRCFVRTIRSIFNIFPNIQVIAGDDSDVPYARDVMEEFSANGYKAKAILMPFDVGVSAGRNRLLRAVETPLFVQVDDDHEFADGSEIMLLEQAVTSGEFDLAGGIYLEKNKPIFWTGWFERNGVELLCHPILYEKNPWTRVDCVHNFFLSKTKMILEMGGWDEELKVMEHMDFFLRAKDHDIRVAHVKGVRLRHFPNNPPKYRKFRGRKNYRYLWMRKHKIHVLVDFLGNRFTLPDSTLML